MQLTDKDKQILLWIVSFFYQDGVTKKIPLDEPLHLPINNLTIELEYRQRDLKHLYMNFLDELEVRE